MAESSGELILYTTDDGLVQMQLRPVNGTVWLSQAEMAHLFDTGIPAINKHIANLLEDGELTEATISKLEIVQQEGSRLVGRQINVYNLDMILGVAYRVRSPRGIQFRQWATTVLREYLIKGFVLDDERLKHPGGVDYFDELLERIRDIRASEARFYQKVRDVFAQTSVDYDSKSDIASTFFATIQNKLVFAVTGYTAAELVVKRADPSKANMGLTSWKGAKVRKADTTVAKNYLNADEIDDLNRLTTQFLDYAETRAKRRQQITMAEWVVKTNDFIQFNEYAVLTNAGRVSHKDMEAMVAERFKIYEQARREREAIEAAREDTEEMQRLEAGATEQAFAELEDGISKITGVGGDRD
ncbi:virulence RhuM family protein [Sphaerisporangium album]|uniref:virulence RhuM family protein n=1 Tax=Sphaerisporangium album TaxID=509200 RepID=UPI001C6924CF|nr:virulence RhuM family protein [Sphaerisporangium album]